MPPPAVELVLGVEEPFGGGAKKGAGRVVAKGPLRPQEVEDTEVTVPKAAVHEAQVEAAKHGPTVRIVTLTVAADVQVATEGPPVDVPAPRPLVVQTPRPVAGPPTDVAPGTANATEVDAVEVTHAGRGLAVGVDEEGQVALKAPTLVAVGPHPQPHKAGRCVVAREVP